ncbi:hypothetical protein [Aquimarina algiphila]|uniref:hypothetical protein n=1 Tax=Aquimarina algiphila TaxID=2047982 RepID=UPI00248FB87F|nr:hypothetical protein [Aquimarina algiphila]
MNLGFKGSIDIDLFKRIIDVRLSNPKGIVSIILEQPISNDLRKSFEDKGFTIIENKLDVVSSELIQYKFEWD